MSPLKTQERRRVFWCVYGIDRVLSILLGRSWGIEDQGADAELPLDIDDDELRTLHQSATDPVVANAPVTVRTAFTALSHLYRWADSVLESRDYTIDCRGTIQIFWRQREA